MKIQAVVAAAVLLTGTASAASEFTRPGAYVSAGFAAGLFTEAEEADEDILEDFGADFDVEYDAAIGMSGALGYRLHPRLALQAHFLYVPRTDIEWDGDKVLEGETLVATGEVKVFLMTNRFQPYVAAGHGVMRIEVETTGAPRVRNKETDYAMRIAGGVDYYINRNTVLFGELSGTLPTDELKDADLLIFTVGAQWRF